MIEMHILKSKAGIENCFELNFRYDDYYPGHIEEADKWSCYQYYTWLFKKHGVFAADSKGKELIYSIQWECKLSDIPFTMIYDEDYDMVHFSVDEEHISDIPDIAAELIRLIEIEAGAQCP
jgi:hypothetical protein